MKYQELYNSIKNAKNILLISHVNPDGDTLGSMVAMYQAVKTNLKKNCKMMITGKLPSSYEFLPDIKYAQHINDFDLSMVYDIVITIDVAAIDRILNAKILFKKAKTNANIDHHKTNINFGEYNIVDGNASSTGEVLFDLFNEWQWDISYETAVCLYTAILSDTGAFRFENTTAKVLNIASKLVEMGVVPKEIYKNCYEGKSKNNILFQAHCISKAEFKNNDKIAYTILYKKDFEKFNAQDDFSEGIVETLRSVNSVKVSFVVKEADTRSYKISMRSKEIDVAKICETFGGGGHKFAAGCTIKSSLNEALNKILNEIAKQDL